MSSESDSNTSFDTISERLQHLMNTSHEYIKLKVFQQIAYTMSIFTKMIFIGSLLLLGLVFLCISGAIAIGDALDSTALGFLIVGGIILLMSGLIYAFRKIIDRKIIQRFSTVFFN